MTDRELLEAAAKAAGYDTSHEWNAYRMTLEPPVIGLCIPGVHTQWNPLDDDGQALRLAVKLHMFDTRGVFEIRLHETRANPNRTDEEIMRRAIVRAAAMLANGGIEGREASRSNGG